MTKYRIPLSYNDIDTDQLRDVLNNYTGRHHNELIHDFEKAIATYTGAKYALALNSGTAAIHLGLRALGVMPGDDVLVSTFTYVASVNPILYLGARPIFIDSEEQTWNMDPGLAELAIQDGIRSNKKPKAMVVVHAYGMPAQLDRLMAISEKYEVPVLEDAAEALGSLYKEKQVGTLGKVGILSFNNNKVMTTYGGGALLTNDYELYQHTLLWCNQARESKLYYEHKEEGYSYRMGPVNAAVGLGEMAGLDERIEKRRWIFDQYRHRLGSEVMFPSEPEGVRSNRWFTTVVLKDEGKNSRVIDKMDSNGIEARFLWNPMHVQPLFAPFKRFGGGFSEQLFARGLVLPSSNDLTANDMDEVCEMLLEKRPGAGWLPS